MTALPDTLPRIEVECTDKDETTIYFYQATLLESALEVFIVQHRDGVAYIPFHNVLVLHILEE